jgi:hypothetical protein
MATYYCLVSAQTNVITGYVKTTAVTVGEFVVAEASDDSVDASTGISTYKASDIVVGPCDANTEYPYVIGIAGETGAVGGYIPVYTEGLFIVRTSAAVTAGAALQKAENTDAAEVCALDSTYAEHLIGKALTSASAADKYIVMLLRI